ANYWRRRRSSWLAGTARRTSPNWCGAGGRARWRLRRRRPSYCGDSERNRGEVGEIATHPGTIGGRRTPFAGSLTTPKTMILPVLPVTEFPFGGLRAVAHLNETGW